MKRLVILLLIASTGVHAQKISLISGNLDGLKKIKSYAIKFNYDSIVLKDNESEREYLQKMKKRWDERELGKGDEFIKQWYGDREKLHEPAFKKSFEKQTGITLGDPTSMYTIILKTRYVEGGWDIGVHGINPVIGGEMWIVETADISKVKAKILFYDSEGTDSYGGDFNMTMRIRSAYVAAGKWLSVFLLRNSKKI